MKHPVFRLVRVDGVCLSGLALLASLFFPVAAMAQLEISLKLQHRSVLQFERVKATVEIKNRGRTPFVVARDVDPIPDLQFVMTREGGKAVVRDKDEPILKDVYILPGKKESFDIYISEWYNLASMGQYLAKATIDFKGMRYTSNRVVLEVVRGIEILSKTAPVPGAEERSFRYGLRYWKRERAEHLFLVIDDPDDDLNYGVFHLGPIIRVARPIIEISDNGDVKTIHQATPHCYAHTVFKVTSESIELLKQSLHLVNGAPCP